MTQDLRMQYQVICGYRHRVHKDSTCVTTNPRATNLDVFLWSELAILHVAEMILALDVIGMDLEEVILRKFQRNGKQDMKRIKDLRVKRLSWTTEPFSMFHEWCNMP